MNKPTIIQAAREVLARCDGAIKKDEVGFTGVDSGFVRSLIEQVDSGRTLSFKQESVLYKLLRKYIRQLDRYGIDYNQIPSPVEKVKKAEKPGPMELRFVDHRLSLKSLISFKDQAKTIPTGRWNPENKTWNYLVRPEVYIVLEPYITSGNIKPSTAAKAALDLARTASQQRSKVDSIKKNNLEKVSLPIKIKPFDHQLKAFQIGITLDQTALLMEQRTGKTLVAIGVAGHRYNKGQIKKLLVICPLTVSSVWTEEFEKADFPYASIDLTQKKDKRRIKDLESLSEAEGLKVVIINHEAAWRCDRLLREWKPDMIVIDESQKIKNGRAKQSRWIHKLGDQVTYKLILTGTPISQGPLDAWSQYRFLNPDIFGRKFVSFRDRYAIMEGLRGHPEIRLVVGYKNLEELTEKVHSIAYRVTLDECWDMKEPVDQILKVNLDDSERKIYRQMEKDFLVDFGNEQATAPIILTQLLRLQQITGGFLPDELGEIHSVGKKKLDVLKEFIGDLPTKKKVVIFCRFIPELKAIEQMLKSLNRKSVTLYGATKDRGEVRKQFRDNPNITILISQIQTGGLGVDLSSADIEIFFSTTFSYTDFDQAKKRVLGPKQKNPVTYIHILARDTVDEHILDILMDKGDMASLIVDRMKKKLSSREPWTNPKKGYSLSNVKVKDNKKEESNLIGLDNKAKGGWYFDETTGNILHKEPDGETYILYKGVKSLEKAREIIKKLNPETEEGETMSKKDRKEAAKAKQEKKAKKAAQVIEETSEEVEEEVEEEEEEEPKETKKAKKVRLAKEEAEKKAKAKKSTKKETKKATPATKEIDPDSVGVKELAGMVNLDPKALRKILREEFPEHEPKSQWVWKRGSKVLTKLVKKLNK